MAVERNFLRDTFTEPGTDGTLVFDLSTTQGSPISTVQGSLNATVFTEVLRFQRTVDDTIAGDSFPVSINISSLEGTIDCRWRVQRINSSGVVQASSPYSVVVSTSGIKTDTLSLTTTWATGDRLAVSVEIARTGGHGTVRINIETQDSDSFVDPDMAVAAQSITVNAATETETAQPITANGPPSVKRVGFDAVDQPASSTTITFDKPAGLAEGDVILVFISHESGAAAVWTPETDFTQLGTVRVQSESNHQSVTFWKTATASEPASYTFSVDVSNGMHGILVVYTNVDATTPIDDDQEVADADSLNPSLTVITERADGALVAFWAYEPDVSDREFSSDDLMNEMYEARPTSLQIAAYDQDVSAADTYIRSFTLTLGSGVPGADDPSGHLIALQEPDTGPQSISVLNATESEAAQAITATSLVAIIVTGSLETEAAQPVTASPGAFSAVIGESIETELVQAVAVGSVVSIVVASAIETEAAIAVVEGAAAVAELQLSGFRIDLEYTVAEAEVVPVGSASESETTQSIGVGLSVGEVLESEAAQTVDPVQAGAPQSEPVTAIIESETAQTIAVATAVSIAVGASTETEAGQVVQTAIAVVVVSTTEAEQTQVLGIGLGVPTTLESEAAGTVAPVQAGAPQTIAVDAATEPESVQSVGIGLEPVAPLESEAAQPITVLSVTSVAVTATVESEATQPVTPFTVVSVSVGVATETEAGGTVDPILSGAPQSISVVGAVESEAGEPVATQAQATLAVAFATESDLAQSVGLALSVVFAPEFEIARLVAPVQAGAPQSRPVDPASETETAEPVAGLVAQSISVTEAVEIETAEPVPLETIISIPVTQATESEQAIAVGVLAGAVSAAVAFASESEQANPITVAAVFVAAIDAALETDQAIAIGSVTGTPLIAVGSAIETETAQVIIADDGIVGVPGGLRDPDLRERTPVLTTRSITPL